jgi:SAM-dependent methyltransferase
MLTDPAFWDDYWKNVSHWQNVDLRQSYDRCFARVFQKWLPHRPDWKLIEIGCAPGRWLIYFHQQFGYQVAGCDSAPEAVAVTRSNVAQAKVPADIVLADFMEDQLAARSYDIVLSLGFIEHFSDPWPAIERHVRLAKPGGTLVVEVPNFTGLNRWFLKQGAHRLLDVHNTRIMHLAFFREIANRFKLDPRFIGHIGGVEPALWDSDGQRGFIRKVVGGADLLRRRLPVLDHVNQPWFSGYLMGIYTVPSGV